MGNELGKAFQEAIELFLIKIKPLILNRKRRFIYRKDRNTLQDFVDLEISGDEHLWKTILEVRASEAYKPPELDHNGSGEEVYFFIKKMPNGINAYIKLKVRTTDNGELCVCLSFHPTTTLN